MSLVPSRCLNCEQPVSGSFCASCGQRNVDYRVSTWELLSDALDGLFQIDSRLGRTVIPFLLRPGFLTREYNAGRRMRYSSPLRIYLLFSVAYFFALSFVHFEGSLNLGRSPGPAGGTRVESQLAITDATSRSEPEVHLGFTRLEQHIRSQIKLLQQADPKEAQRRLKEGFLAQASKGLIFLLPVFALLLKLLYLGRRRFYIEHLTCALHLHAYVLFILLLCLLPPLRAHLGGMLLLCYVQLVLALRAVYGESIARTLCKSLALLFLYSLAGLVGLVGIAFFTLLLL